jgi:hypothetical protein
MASIEDLLTNKLSQDNYSLWARSWAAIVARVLARPVIACFDFGSGRVTGTLPPILDPSWRVRVIQSADDIAALCEAELIQYIDVLNAAVTEGSDSAGRRYSRRTEPRMRNHLGAIHDSLVSAPVSSAIVATVSPIEIWRAVANELGRAIHGNIFRNVVVPDSVLHNQLLVAGYFWACNLPSELPVSNELSNFSKSLLSIEGTLVDIVERASPKGIEDRRPTIVKARRQFTLRHQSLSPLLDMLANEAQNIAGGQGFLMRWLGTIQTDTGRQVDPVLMQKLRVATYPQYEYSVISFMALSAVEQILRTFAHHSGLFNGHVRLTPSRLDRLVQALGGDAAIEEAIATVYDDTRGNLRNRILHGAQLHIARSQQQATMSIAFPMNYVPPPDALSPENVFLACFESLQVLDQRISDVASLSHGDFAWTQHLALKPAELRVGMQVRYEFVGDEGKHWWNRIDDFLTALTPNIKILFNVGFMGWIDRKRPERFVLFMALNMVLEALVRVIVRLQGGSVLKRMVPSNPDEAVEFRYRMLDQRELCAPETLDRLVESVHRSERELAKTVLTLAVRVRDAVAHGAIVALEMDDGIAMGHLVVKAIQCLVEAGEHEMIKTAAYYRSEDTPDEDALANWLQGEHDVLHQIQAMVQLRGGL